MTPLDGFGSGGAVIAGLALVCWVGTAVRATVRERRAEGSVRDWRRFNRTLAATVGRTPIR